MSKRNQITIRQIPSGKWRYGFSFRGQWVSGKVQATRDGAYRAGREHQRQLEAGEVRVSGDESFTLDALIAEFITRQRPYWTEGTRRFYKVKLKAILDGLGEELDLRDALETKYRISSFVEKRRAEVKPQTVNKEIGVINFLLKFARVELEEIEYAHTVKKIPVQKTSISIPTEEEVERAVEYAVEEKTREAIQFFCDTGLRFSEFYGLTWEDIDLDNGKLLVRRSKNHLSRWIPLTERAMGILGARAAEKGESSWVFHNKGRQYTQGMGKAISRAFRLAGIDYQRPHHTLRHVFASRLANRGASMFEVKELLGHQDIALTANLYSHLFDDTARQTIDLLNPPKGAGAVIELESRRGRSGGSKS